MPSKRSLRKEIEQLIDERTERGYELLGFQEKLEKAEKERDSLRRQLSTIREKHGPLHEALYPDLVSPIFTGISPSVAKGLISWNNAE